MIRLNAFARTTDEHRDEFIRLARELVAASLGDEGCVAYDLFTSATRPDVLMICETWRDDAALAAHKAASHFTRIVPRLRELAEMKTERFDF